MNSTRLKLGACVGALSWLADNVPSPHNERDHMEWFRTVNEVQTVLTRVIASVGTVRYGCELPPFRVERWSMSREEWEGQN